MGYRPNLVKEYSIQYGAELSGFNYKVDEFGEFLEKIGVSYDENESQDRCYIKSADLIALEKRLNKQKFDESELCNIRALIDIAKNSSYAKRKDGCVIVEWF